LRLGKTENVAKEQQTPTTNAVGKKKITFSYGNSQPSSAKLPPAKAPEPKPDQTKFA